MTTWLEPAEAKALVSASANAEDPAWIGDVAAAREYIEGRRPDLLVGTPAVFTAGAAVKLGTAMLAHRLWMRRTSPLGTSQNVEFGGSDFLRQDPDIAKLCGIGIEGKFVIGGARAAELDAQAAQQ
ncbi:hypothetical protein ABZX12_18585 [Kribbella sp. NPDC003505]|uniref:hypothetical protein n=1 Tax=Kribbella sp. NPDC003505 TaxID=3154448 RepID=UPI0033BC5F30